MNPFVDESDMGDGFNSGTIGDGSMGLFGDEDEEERSEIDSSVADASADEFFDDEFEDETDEFEDFDDGGVDDEFEGSFDSDEADIGNLDDDLDEDVVDDGSGGEGGKSFEELKAEYDSGEAEWDETDSRADSDADESSEMTDDGLDGGEVGDELDGVSVGESHGALDEGRDAATEDGAAEPSTSGTRSPIDGGKPYLETLPPGYVADIVVMDWLEYLVEEAGVDGAAQTIAYYETIGWLDGAAADTLQTFLNGFGSEVEADPEPQSSLTVEHHNASLRYISRIANPDMGMVAFEERTDRREPHSMGGAKRATRPAGRSFDPAGRSPVHREVESDGGRNIDARDERRSSRHGRPDRPERETRGDGRFDWRDDHVE